jgi:hypothetical protein
MIFARIGSTLAHDDRLPSPVWEYINTASLQYFL